jgi:hypothetical protein
MDFKTPESNLSDAWSDSYGFEKIQIALVLVKKVVELVSGNSDQHVSRTCYETPMRC